MECTICYLKEIYENKPNEIASKIMKGRKKTSQNGTKYVLIEEIDENFTPLIA